LLIGFLRRMSSSLPALAVSLGRVGTRLRETFGNAALSLTPLVAEFAADLEEEVDDDSSGSTPLPRLLRVPALGSPKRFGSRDFRSTRRGASERR